MVEESVEENSERFATTDNAKATVGDSEECLRCTRKADNEITKNGKDQTSYDFKWKFQCRVLQKESFYTIGKVVIFPIEYVSFARINWGTL